MSKSCACPPPATCTWVCESPPAVCANYVPKHNPDSGVCDNCQHDKVCHERQPS